MKKRILFNIHYLEIGGAETSLIGLLHSLNPDHFHIDLLINDPRGELMRFIPAWVNILPAPEAYRMIERPLVEVLKRRHFKVVCARMFARYKFNKYISGCKPSDGNAIFGYVGKYVTPLLPSLKYLGEYDVAVSYVTPHNIILEKIKAKKKIAWIHTDYSKINVDSEIELPVWSAYDKIVSISPSVTASFLSVFPSLRDKIIEIENFLPEEMILSRAKDFIPEDMPKEEGIVNILTIGRYSYQKNLDSIPILASKLKSKRINFKWYIIGYGNQNEFDKIKNQISLNKVDKEVIILGKKENPYPYLAASDIYVQPSRYEGKSITVREAQLLGKPVVITNYPTAGSQLENHIDGFIGPYETESFAEYLTTLILDKDLQKKIKENLSLKDFSQKENMQKFLSVIAS